MSFLKRLFGGGGGAAADTGPKADPVEYKGFLITPDPISADGQYRISAHIDRLALELPRQQGFGPGAGIDVRGVERCDSRIECGVDRCVRGCVVHLRAVRNPVAVRQGADLQSTAPEVPKFHDHKP